MRGRKPLPTRLHVARGTYQRSRHGGRDPEAPNELPPPPEDLTPEQQTLWQAAVEQAPWLRAADATLLLLWVEVTDRHRRARIAQAEMDANSEFPLLRRDPRTGEIKASPYIRELTRAGETMLRCAQELGFSPTARTRLATAPAKPPSSDPAEGPWAKLKLLEGGHNSDETA